MTRAPAADYSLPRDSRSFFDPLSSQRLSYATGKRTVPSALLWWVVGLLPLWAGCAQVRAVGKSPLGPAMLPNDSIALEKCTIRFDQADPALDEEIWSEIDEECLPPALRARLAANGFRAGVIGPHLPAALEVVIRENATSTPTTTASEQPPPATEELGVLDATPVDLMREPKIRRSLWQTQPGHPGLIVTAGERARIPQVAVLMRDEEGRVAGRTYERVLGALSMKAMPERDGRVHLEVIPQFEHGEPRSRFVAADGMIKPDYRPETVLFKELQIDAILAPGQTLILGTRADKPGSLGSHFFTERGSASTIEQKLLMVRVAHAPSDDRFRTNEIPLARP